MASLPEPLASLASAFGRLSRVTRTILIGFVVAGLLGSVGAYKLEGEGAQLFERIEGDYFSVMGLALGRVIELARRHGFTYAFAGFQR